jgi:CheY-like chemotaxis protein
LRILIAEDEPVSRETLAAYLTHWGYEVVTCANGVHAWAELERLGSEAPRLLLIDWIMPEMDGIELCRRLRRKPETEQNYIIMVTAKDQKEDVITGLRAGADDYVVKPFDESDLHARVQVGARVVGLWERLLEAERMRVLTQTAGAAAHEINQPLSVILGLTQLLLLDQGLGEQQREKLLEIGKAVRRIDDLVQKMATVRRYATRTYVGDIDIVDFEADGTGSSEKS